MRFRARVGFLIPLGLLLLLTGCAAEPEAPPPEEPPELTLDTHSLRFEVDSRFSEAPYEATILVTNTGGGTLDWVALSSGEVRATCNRGEGGTGQATIRIAPHDLGIGQHHDTVDFFWGDQCQTVDIVTVVVPYEEAYHETFELDPFTTTREGWVYGKRSVRFTVAEHQEIELVWKTIGPNPNVYVMLEGGGERYNGFASRPGGQIDYFKEVASGFDLVTLTAWPSPLYEGHSTGAATDMGKVTIYFSTEYERVGQRVIYLPGSYTLEFEALSDAPSWYNGIVSSETRVELDYTITDVED